MDECGGEHLRRPPPGQHHGGPGDHPADSAAMQAAKLYYQADLKISTDTAGVTTAKDKNDNPVDISGCNVTTQSFYDKREEATMTVTEGNVGTLQTCGKAPAHGILYVPP